VHGRRRGRKLRPGQKNLLDETLPRWICPAASLAGRAPADIFATGDFSTAAEPKEIWLEIGFGGGEHAAYQARANPKIGLIACEVFENGIVSMLAHIERENIGNIRIVREDAHLALEALPEASVARAFLLFPDPWPKTRHHKRRFVSPETMAHLARILGDGAELRMATDDMPYLRVMLATACGHPDFEWQAERPDDWRRRPVDWPQTRYEAKALAVGRTPAYLRLLRRKRAAD
jgi:tRNA (guanine-N7-)-methyltransferase